MVDPDTGWRFYKRIAGNLQTREKPADNFARIASQPTNSFVNVTKPIGRRAIGILSLLQQAVTTCDIFLRGRTGFGCLENNPPANRRNVNSTPTNTARIRVAQHDHISSREHAWLRELHSTDCTSLCLKKKLSSTCHVSSFAAPEPDHRFRKATRSNTVSDGLAKSPPAPSNDRVTLHVFSMAWEVDLLHRSMALSTMQANNFVSTGHFWSRHETYLHTTCKDRSNAIAHDQMQFEHQGFHWGAENNQIVFAITISVHALRRSPSISGGMRVSICFMM